MLAIWLVAKKYSGIYEDIFNLADRTSTLFEIYYKWNTLRCPMSLCGA